MRLGWADVARGAAMVLVVFAHALQLLQAYDWSPGPLATVNTYLTVLRMPLFFLVSGIFAVSAVQRGWRGLFASRLALLLYVYLLWSLVRALWFSVVPWPSSDVPPWTALIVAPVWPTTGLWFLFALVVYLVLARLTWAAPAWLPLGVGGAVNLLAAYDLVPTGGNGVWRSVAMYAFYFLLGVRLPAVWRSVADRSTPLNAAAAVVVIGLSVVVFTLLPSGLRGLGRTALSLVCVAACLLMAAAVTRWGPLARPLQHIGQRTIAIYVAHPLLLALLVPLIPVGAVPVPLVVLVLTGAGVLLPLALRRVLKGRSGVFDLPSSWARSLALQRTGRPAPAS